MADDNGELFWYDPDPRAILPLDQFHISRSLTRTVHQRRFQVRINTAFDAVIHACSQPAPGREHTWISVDIIAAYKQLHRLGFAHSVETWYEGALVGGLYGVAVNAFFAGESMFSHARDGSKIALVHLVDHLRRQGFLLLDVQFLTDHLQRFGAIEIPRAVYRERLAHAINFPVPFSSVQQKS